MDTEEIYPLYEWTPGHCFRHPLSGEIDTTCIVILHPQSGPAREVRACIHCVLTLEEARLHAAKRAGADYAPGQLADCGG